MWSDSAMPGFRDEATAVDAHVRARLLVHERRRGQQPVWLRVCPLRDAKGRSHETEGRVMMMVKGGIAKRAKASGLMFASVLGRSYPGQGTGKVFAAVNWRRASAAVTRNNRLV